MKKALLFSLFLLACSPAQAQDSTALFSAIEAGDVSRVAMLLKAGLSASDMNESGSTPLMTAVNHQQTAIVNLLLRAGADVNAQQQDGYQATALMLAMQANDMDIAEALLAAGAEVNTADKNGDPAINWAAYYGHLETSALLLSHGADITLRGHGNALEIAIRRGHQALIDLLLSNTDALNPLRPEDLALQQAIEQGDLEALESALETGANANALDDTGRPMLARAARLGHVILVYCLLEKGATVDLGGPISFTSLMEAAREGHQEVVELLLERGAEVNHVSSPYGLSFTPMHLAAIGGDVAIIDALATAGADLDRQDVTGATPALWALYEGKNDASARLITLGADPDMPSRDGYTVKALAESAGIEPVLTAISAVDQN